MVGPQISVGHYRIFHMIAVGLQVTMRGITGGRQPCTDAAV